MGHFSVRIVLYGHYGLWKRLKKAPVNAKFQDKKRPQLGPRNKKAKKKNQRALRDILMSRGKNCLSIVSRQFLTRNYPRPNRLLKCLPNCLSPTGEGIFSSFKITPAVRVIARQLRDKNCPGAIFAPGHQDSRCLAGPTGKKKKNKKKSQRKSSPQLSRSREGSSTSSLREVEPATALSHQC